MKFSEKWLREWVDPALSTGELVERLTMAGLEVDTVEPAAPAFQQVVVGEVLDVQPHPDADKLRVCTVNAGSNEHLQIVCGAPNVHAGMRAPVALIGGRLPGNVKIKKTKLRGVESQGMLCSGRELGLSEDHQGILALPVDAPVSKNLRDYLELDDAVIDIDLTPNRGDCLGIEGIAREVGALTNTKLKVPEILPVPATGTDQFPVEILDTEACPRYLGRVIRGVSPQAATPSWMQEKLRRSGLRSIGPVVDVTNYVLLELGQPLHAFDLEKLEGGIRVRKVKAGEKITLLDENVVELDADTLLITDHRKVLAMAGIMGGEDSGISEATTDLFLECAYFKPEAIAGRARRYGLQTESSFRFERGVDPTLQHRAIERATQLLLQLVGGEAGPVTEVSFPQNLPIRGPINLRAGRLKRVSGLEVPDQEVAAILERLGAKVKKTKEGWDVTPPSFRFDISVEADLIEEVVRVFGYDQVPSTPPSGSIEMAACPEAHVSLPRIRSVLVGRGYQEAITYSFVEAGLQKLIDAEHRPIVLSNPISSEMSVMRTTLWPGLIQTAQFNQHRQQNQIRLFEQGLRFRDKDGSIEQDAMVAGLIMGNRHDEQWGIPSVAADFFDVKSDVEALLELGGHADEFIFEQSEHPALHPGQSAKVCFEGRDVGWVGAIHPELVGTLELARSTFLFEIEQKALQKGRIVRFEEISKFPSVRRDLALVVDREVASAAIRAAIEAEAEGLLKQLVLFDVYEGERVELARKSLALGLILQDSEGTLTDTKVNSVIKRVTERLNKDFGAQLRE